jgi:hypothetical protein
MSDGVMNKRRIVVCSLIVILGAVTAGCSSPTSPKRSAGPSSTAGPTSTAPTTAPSTGAPPSTPSTSITGTAPCTTADLAVSIEQEGAAAGTAHLALVFTNTGSASCKMQGYPGVSVVGASGNQIGPAATRTSAGTPPLVTLAPGGATTAVVTLSDVLNSCSDPASPDGFRVYPPDQTTALYAPYQQFVYCQNAPSGTLQIGPMGVGIGAAQSGQ